MNQYIGFGLRIDSEIEFPELLSGKFETHDLEIICGKVPENIEGISFSTPGYKYAINDNEFLFKVLNTAQYYANNGNKITIELCKEVKAMRDVRLYVLATVMAAVLLHKRLLPLHTSAISYDDGLYCISGDSGAGKTTVLSLLLKKGYKIFSDDVVVLNKDAKNGVTAYASYPMIKLWGDTLDKIDSSEFQDKSFPVKSGIDKYGFFFHDKFSTKCYPIRKIFILKKKEIPCIHSKELKGGDAFDILSKQIYRPMLIHNNDLRMLSFMIISNLAKSSRIYEITRPMTCNPNDLSSYIENLIRN